MRSSVHDEVSAQQNQGAEPKQMRDRYFGSIFLLESVQATHLVTVLIKKKNNKKKLNGYVLLLPLNSR